MAGFAPIDDTTPRRLVVRRALAFVGAGAPLAYMAFEGAAYDVVPRQQAALVVWAVVAFGFGFGVLPRSRFSKLALIPLAAAVALVAWMAFSLLWTDSAERTTLELARLLTYLGFVTLALTALNRHTFRAAAAGISVAAFAVVAVAVISRLSPSTFPDALAVAQRFGRSDRLDFPLDYWNALGTWGAMAAAIALAWSAHTRSRVLRAVNLAVVPVAAVAVYVSYSRGAVLASAVALVAVLVLSRNRWTAFLHALAACGGSALAILAVRDQPEIADATGGAGGGAVALTLLGAAAICAGAVVLTWVLDADRGRLSDLMPVWAVRAMVGIGMVAVAVAAQGPVSTAWDEFQTEDTPVSSDDPAARLTSAGGNRDDVWDFALDVFRERPLAGVGPGTFEFRWQADGGDPEFVRDAHSLYLEVLAELGIIGLLLLLSFLAGLLAVALYARRSLRKDSDFGAHVAMTSVFLVFTVSAGLDWMWEETAVGLLGLGGLAVAAAGAASRLRRSGRRGQMGRRGVRAAVVVAAVAAAAVQVPGLAATDRMRASEAALAAGNLDTAEALAEDAVDAQPWSASAHAHLAAVAGERGDLDRARDEAREALDLEPTNWRWPLVLAAIKALAGDRDAAIRIFERGRRLAPEQDFYSPTSGVGQLVYGAAG